MKKGCFFTSFVVLTILISAGIYISKNNSAYVIHLFKPVIISSMRAEFDRRIKKVEKSELTDSLKSLVDMYSDELKKTKTLEMSDAQFFFDNIRDMMHDGHIDSSEISDATILLNKNRNHNERSAKN